MLLRLVGKSGSLWPCISAPSTAQHYAKSTTHVDWLETWTMEKVCSPWEEAAHAHAKKRQFTASRPRYTCASNMQGSEPDEQKFEIQ